MAPFGTSGDFFDAIGLNWSDSTPGLPADQLEGLNGRLQLEDPAGKHTLLLFNDPLKSVTEQRSSCGTTLVHQAASDGVEYPFVWGAFEGDLGTVLSENYGCGLADITRSQPGDIEVRLKITDDAGAAWDARPSYTCVGGKAVAVVHTAAGDFDPNPGLSARVSKLAGKHVTVECSPSDSAWQHFFRDENNLAGEAPGGVTLVGSSTAYLPKWECYSLLHVRSVSTVYLAQSILGIAHEVEHMRGVADERKAECAALATVPHVLKQWGVTDDATVTKLEATAAKRHRLFYPHWAPC